MYEWKEKTKLRLTLKRTFFADSSYSLSVTRSMADFLPSLNHRAKKKGGSAFKAKESQPLAFTFTEGDEGLQKTARANVLVVFMLKIILITS